MHVRSTDRVVSLASSVPSLRPSGAADTALWDTIADFVLGEDELLGLLDLHCDIQANDIPNGVGVLEHAAGVALIGARGVAIEQDFYGAGFEARFPVAIEFAASTDESNAPVSPAKELAPSTRKIFATFASDSVLAGKVLVKWTDLDRNTVLICGKYAIEPQADHSFVWVETEDDWPVGAYAVEVYSMSGDLPPIAGGRYVVR